MSSFFPLFTEYSFEYHLLRAEMHFEQNYQELWRNHAETTRPNDGAFTMRFIRERMKLTQASHQRNG